MMCFIFQMIGSGIVVLTINKKDMSRKFYEVPKKILLIIAGIIWMIAGFVVNYFLMLK